MSHDAFLHPESLLDHGPRLRALARRLVHDDHLAEDLVQETWLRALQRGPAGEPPLRRWLGTVLRNLAFQERKLEAHRSQRERVAARGEGSDAGAETHERFALHRELVAAIDRLGEPYREVLLLRYFDGLPPRRIAARLGLPVKTVKTRLNRGVAHLRQELDRAHGGREAWLAALLPLAHMGAPGSGLLGGASAALRASATLKVAAAAVLVSAGVYLALPRRGEPAPLAAAVLTEPIASPVSRTTQANLVAPPVAAAITPRVALAATAPAVPAPAPAPALALHGGLRHGRVLGPDGVGLAGVSVGFALWVSDAPPPVLSGADGGFELPDLAGDVMSRDERFATVLISRLTPESAPAEERLVVVAPAVSLGGTVRDEQGEPAAHVPLRMEIPLSFRGRFREVLDSSQEYTWSTESDEQGRFLLAGAPALPSLRLAAWSGHTSARVAVPEHDALDLELVLQRSEAAGPDALHVVGEVRHGGGALAPATLVSLAGVSTQSGADSLFELHVPPAGAREPRRLVAVRAGEQAAFFQPDHDANGGEIWPSFVTLWLGAAPKSIEGRVLGADDAPLAGAPVWITDPVFLGPTHSGFLTVEHQMAGKSDLERWFCVPSDENGRFVLDGLGERSYTLAAMDPTTLQVVRSQPIPAGSQDVELAFSNDGLFERVAGRAVDTRGQPIAGVGVQLRRTTFEVRSPKGDLWYGSEQCPLVLTDDDGRFEFERVPREGMVLHVAGTAFVAEVELEHVADPLDVEVVAPRLRHVQVVLAGTAPEEGSIELCDGEGRPLEVYVFAGESISIRDSIDLGNANDFANGRTPALSVPESARSVILRDGAGNELRRAALELGEELVTVQL